MIQSKRPFLDALVNVILDLWDENVLITPRESAIMRYVETRIPMHGRDQIRSTLRELAEFGVLRMWRRSPRDISYGLSPEYMWPGNAGFLDLWRTVLRDPRLYVAEDGNCWAYGTPTHRGYPKLHRLPCAPHFFGEFLAWRANYHVIQAGYYSLHPEVEMVMQRAIGEAALLTARDLFSRVKPASLTVQRILEDELLRPVAAPGAGPLPGQRRRLRWRPEDDAWGCLDNSVLVLCYLSGKGFTVKRAPFKPRRIFRDLDARLGPRIRELLAESPPLDAEPIREQLEGQPPEWVVLACKPRRRPPRARHR